MSLFRFNLPIVGKRYLFSLVLPILIIAVSLFFFRVLYIEAFSRISKYLHELVDARKKQVILEDKVNVLRQVRDSNLIASDISYIALSEKNPTTMLVSHIKTLSEEYGILLKNLNLSDSDTNELEEGVIQAEFEVEISSTDIQTIVNFLNELSKISPLVRLKEADINLENDGKYFTKTKLLIFWSPLPESLPALTQPIENFSSQELELLGQISKLKTPVFSKLNPQKPLVREIPFN